MKVKLVSGKTELNNDLYLGIVDLFRLLEEQTKNQEDKLIRTDGTTYYFAVTDKNGHVKIGETWSPGDKTIMGRVIKVCNDIYSIGNGQNISQTELLEEIDNLLSNLKQ